MSMSESLPAVSWRGLHAVLSKHCPFYLFQRNQVSVFALSWLVFAQRQLRDIKPKEWGLRWIGTVWR